jgi:hypothetical protein
MGAPTAVQRGKGPGLVRMKVDALDSLAASVELALPRPSALQLTDLAAIPIMFAVTTNGSSNGCTGAWGYVP